MLRSTNRAGGLEGGMTNGEDVRVRIAMKPISTVPRALQTVDMTTGEPAVAIHQRSDVCAVPAAGVVAEAMVALVRTGRTRQVRRRLGRRDRRQPQRLREADQREATAPMMVTRKRIKTHRPPS